MPARTCGCGESFAVYSPADFTFYLIPPRRNFYFSGFFVLFCSLVIQIYVGRLQKELRQFSTV